MSREPTCRLRTVPFPPRRLAIHLFSCSRVCHLVILYLDDLDDCPQRLFGLLRNSTTTDAERRNL